MKTALIIGCGDIIHNVFKQGIKAVDNWQDEKAGIRMSAVPYFINKDIEVYYGL